MSHGSTDITTASLTDLANRLLDQARRAGTDSAQMDLFNSKALRSVLIALTDGGELADQSNPGDAVLHVVFGTVNLEFPQRSDDETAESWSLDEHTVALLPQGTYSVTCDGEAAYHLTSVPQPAVHD